MQINYTLLTFVANLPRNFSRKLRILICTTYIKEIRIGIAKYIARKLPKSKVISNLLWVLFKLGSDWNSINYLEKDR